MITTGNDSVLRNLINTSHNLHVGSGCTIEYNMNSMVNDIVVTGPLETVATAPFKKLFPVDAIVKPIRPEKAGVKYYVLGPVSGGDVTSQEYANQKLMTNPKNVRLYIPGDSLVYKYYLSALGGSESLSIAYPKKIFTNKITVKFETSHSEPTSFSIYGTPYGGSETLLKSGLASNIADLGSNNAGSVNIYYTGSAWSFNESDLAPSSYVELSNVKLTFAAPSQKYVGVIEVAPKYVIDVSEDIMSFSITKDSSADTGDSLPVGYVSANTLELDLNKYNKTELKIKSYDKSVTNFESNMLYFFKMAEVKPYIKIFHDAGLLGTTNKYDKIPQGTFYMDASEISEFGDVNFKCLDGAKILQETIPQDAVCEKYAATAIISRMLDNIGFTNYNFNLKDENETSIISPIYWWTDDTKTVWEHIQELCRDSQMTAIFDENNILQFYSRDFLYGKTALDWTMYSETDGSNLPNIIEFSKEDLPSANKVKVLWQTPQMTQANDSGNPVWQSSTTYLAAYEVGADILTTHVAGDYMTLNAVITNEYTKELYANTFSGFLLINAEVIEFDALQYAYVPSGGGSKVFVDIESQSDILKYNALAEPGSSNFQPTGKFRIKTRAALGTTIANHYAKTQSILSQWTIGGTEFNSSKDLATAPSAKLVNNSKSGELKQSLFKISNTSTVPNHYEIAYRSFPSVTSQSGSTTKYYAFGTTLFMTPPANVTGDPTASDAGFSFFVGSGGTTMYLVEVRTSIITNLLGGRDVQIFKVVNGNKVLLADNQAGLNQVVNIIQGEAYKLDVMVSSTSSKNVITVYFNGFKITATDQTSPLTPTSNIGMLSLKGDALFDYVYGMDIEEETFRGTTGFNIYTGKYTDETLDFIFGKVLFDTSGLGSIDAAVEDFGPVAREIRYNTLRYNTRPAYPLKPSIGINDFVKILGYRMSPFGAQVYVINNTGTYVSLADGQDATYFIAGKTLSISSQLEYTNYNTNLYTTEEPIIFESVWLQTLGDVKNLADWIKTQWAKKQSIIKLNIFANPMISVGDVISIKYDYQDIPIDQKFLVTSVQQAFGEGLDTSIVCRTL